MNNIDILNTNEDVINPKYSIKGVLLPKVITTDKQQLKLRFGSFVTTLSFDQLKRGFALSPMSLSTCENARRRKDPTKFYIFLAGNRLFASTGFQDLESEEVLGNVNKQYLKIFSEEHASFHTEDNYLEVLHARDNVVFSMQFSAPDLVNIQGYFLSSSCVYVAAGDSLYSHPKSGTYHIQQALPEIRQIKKIYNYDAE